MPQFDSSTFSSQIFWLFLSGSLLVSFVRFVLLPRVEIIFRNRKKFLNKEHDSINVLEQQLADIKETRQKELHAAEKKAHDFLLFVKKNLETEKKQHIDSLEKEMNDKIASFEDRLLKKTTTAKDEYKKNVDSYLNIIKQEITSNGSE